MLVSGYPYRDDELQLGIGQDAFIEVRWIGCEDSQSPRMEQGKSHMMQNAVAKCIQCLSSMSEHKESIEQMI